MSGGTKGGGVLDRHGLPGDASWPPPSPLSLALAAAAGDELAINGLGADISALKLLSEEAASGAFVNGACVNGPGATAAD